MVMRWLKKSTNSANIDQYLHEDSECYFDEESDELSNKSHSILSGSVFFVCDQKTSIFFVSRNLVLFENPDKSFLLETSWIFRIN